jgi:hypothetical protein
LIHRRCLGQNEDDCPKCAASHRLAQEIKRTQEVGAQQYDEFFQKLNEAEQGFTVIADYLGRNAVSNLSTQL